MLGLKGRTTRPAFVVWMPILFALVVAQPFFYALLHRGLLQSSGCARDTCGALSLVQSLYLKPIMVFVCLALFVWPTVRRSRDAGMPGWIGLVVPMLLSIDAALFLFAGAPWTLSFTLGQSGRLPPPIGTLAALIATIALAIPVSQPPRDWQRVPKDWFERIAVGAVIATLAARAAKLLLLYILAQYSSFPSAVYMWAARIQGITFLIFLIAAVVVLVRRLLGKPALAA